MSRSVGRARPAPRTRTFVHERTNVRGASVSQAREPRAGLDGQGAFSYSSVRTPGHREPQRPTLILFCLESRASRRDGTEPAL